MNEIKGRDTKQAIFCLRYHNRGGATVNWLEHLFDTGFGHGGPLGEALGGAGDSDAGHTSDHVLKAFEEAGWIIRGTYSPTREQLFFGVGGLSGKALRNPQPFHAKLYGWSPDRKHEREVRQILEDLENSLEDLENP